MKSQDLTEGRIGRQLIVYFLPIAAGTLFQQLYNAADAVIVGKFVGTVALAAVGGSAAQIMNLLIGFFVSLTSGAAVVVAHQFGAKDEESLKKGVSTAVMFCILTGIAVSGIGLVFTKPLLKLLKTPEETLPGAVSYLRIIFLGVVAQLLYNIEAGILRAVGDSRSPFLYLLASCFTNIVLDLLFVTVFDLGVPGVALATIMSQIMGAVLTTTKLCRTKKAYRVDLKNLSIDRAILRKMVRIGVPAGLQGSMYSVSNAIIQIAVNTLGTTVVAAWSLSGKIDGFYWSLSNAAGVAVMNFAAQNFGAAKMDRVKECEKISMKIFMGMTVAMIAILLSTGKLALPLFTDDRAVIDATFTVMLWVVPAYVLWTYIELVSGILRGVGDAVVPVIILGIGIALFRILWILIAFRLRPTLEIVCLSYALSWGLTDIALFVYYRSGKWQRNALRGAAK